MTNFTSLKIIILCFLLSFFTSTSFAAEGEKVTRSEIQFQVPDVTVVRQDGKKLSLAKELDDGRPVVLDFIFTSCTAICPMLTQTFSKLQTQLEKDQQKVHLVSITIDPEHDTPAKLKEFSKKYKAGPNWDFYSSSQEVNLTIQKAFNSYRGDKMNHGFIYFMRAAPGQAWIRLDGFMSYETLFSHYIKMQDSTKK
jgi:protein SCO1/2